MEAFTPWLADVDPNQATAFLALATALMAAGTLWMARETRNLANTSLETLESDNEPLLTVYQDTLRPHMDVRSESHAIGPDGFPVTGIQIRQTEPKYMDVRLFNQGSGTTIIKSAVLESGESRLENFNADTLVVRRQSFANIRIGPLDASGFQRYVFLGTWYQNDRNRRKRLSAFCIARWDDDSSVGFVAAQVFTVPDKPNQSPSTPHFIDPSFDDCRDALTQFVRSMTTTESSLSANLMRILGAVRN